MAAPAAWLAGARKWLARVLLALFLVFLMVLFSPCRNDSAVPSFFAASENDWDPESELKNHVEYLAGSIGERNVYRPVAYKQAAAYIEESLSAAGLEVDRQEFKVEGLKVGNIIGLMGREHQKAPVLVIGAHYDSVFGSPGANDNASAVAALLSLAARLARHKTQKTIYFAAFANEEPPWFRTAQMGSYVFAKSLKDKKMEVELMLSLETMAYFSDEPGSQHYPFPLQFFYPNRGNFIAFVSNLSSRRALCKLYQAFRQASDFPAEKGALPGWMPGIGLSDHRSFWQFGYPGVMLTDTAMFRYPYYHTPEDTPDKLDYQRLSQVVIGLERAIRALSS